MIRRPAPKMAAGWANLDADDLELDSVLPGQYDGRVASWTPEKRLQAAVLADAARRAHHQKERAWFAAREIGPFTFLGICESLDIAPEPFLRRLAERST